MIQIHFLGVSFVECTFDNCFVINEPYLDSSKEVSIIKEKVKDCQILENYIYHQNDESKLFNELENGNSKYNLEYFWN